MNAANFALTASKELGLAPHKMIIAEPEIPGLKRGTANVFINYLTNTIIVTPKAAEVLSDDELCGIVSHELGHAYNKHFVGKMAVDGIHLLLSGINLFLPLPIWKKLLIELGLTVAEIAVKYKMFHAQEFEADEMSFRFGLQLQLAAGLSKMDVANERFKPTNKMMAALGGLTHPPIEKRVKRLTTPIVNR